MRGIEKASIKIYIFRRLLELVPLFLGVIILCFLIIHLTPGDPIAAFTGDIGITEEYAVMMRGKMGLNQPLYMQLLIYMKSILSGDLGFSVHRGKPVLDLILQSLPYTLLLQGSAFVLSSTLGIFIGVIASKKLHSLTDNLVTILSTVGYSMPAFLLGQILILIFSLYLGLFPTSGSQELRVELSGLAAVGDLLHHAFLPVVTSMVWSLALVSRMTRASMLGTLPKDFITAARSKGLSERIVFYRHALKNALLPVITILGINLGYLISGTVVIESVFSYPGMGLLLWRSALERDYPTVMGIFIFSSLSILLANLITDVLYAIVDPRVRYK